MAAGFHSGLTAPGASTVPNVLALAGPVGLLAPVLCAAPAVAWHRRSPAVGFAPASIRRSSCLVPMAFVLAVVVSCEVAAALALSWLMTPESPGAVGARISAAAAALIANLVALPGSVLLVAASAVSYAWLRGQAKG